LTPPVDTKELCKLWLEWRGIRPGISAVYSSSNEGFVDIGHIRKPLKDEKALGERLGKLGEFRLASNANSSACVNTAKSIPMNWTSSCYARIFRIIGILKQISPPN
jgi:hypothetical protein